MLKTVKDFIKTKPRIYDTINSMRPIQNETEVWLDKFSKSNHRAVKFIQVGTSDGLRWDPVRRFILRDNWTGVLIEPLYAVFKMLKENYLYANKENLFFENCAITNNNDSTMDFWSYSAEFLESLSLENRLYYLRKSSVDKKQVEKSLIGVDNAHEKIECYKTKCMTLNAVIEKYFSDNRVDLVFIDAEGNDDYIIKTIDFQKFTPKAIFYESHNLGSRITETEEFLTEKGYAITRLAGDTVATMGL